MGMIDYEIVGAGLAGQNKKVRLVLRKDEEGDVMLSAVDSVGFDGETSGETSILCLRRNGSIILFSHRK